ncbi:MAG TPA: hypothetical protein VFO85_12720 [Vicinamibacteria bacterium]|nr:hypothetical protein [Vicinamibacteria bacterium]
MKGTWLGAGLLAAALLAVPGAAGADDWRDDRGWRRDDGRYSGYGDARYGRYGRYGRTFDLGFDRGFRDGTKQGQKDASRRRGFKPGRHDDYRDGDEGYRSSYGSRREYTSGYRRGFEEGYRAAFDQYYGRGGRRYDPYGYARPRY